MGVRLYPKATIDQIANILGYSNEDMEIYREYDEDDFINCQADMKSSVLRIIANNGFGKFDLRILKRAGFDDDGICGGSTDNCELAANLFFSSSLYDSVCLVARVYPNWREFFAETGGVSWS